MIKVEFYGTLRSLMNLDMLNVEAGTIKELIVAIEEKTKIACKSELRNAITFVNQENFLKLKKYNTKLIAGDEVVFLSPASGG
ncbi:MAG: MoaD/ThiS family protein [Clostridiales bacterium]|nr:MoaD/ThiS family protein [Clostridiales bacterium]